MSLPVTEPTAFRAGESLAWQRDLAEYLPADGWALKYRLLWPSGQSPVNINAVASGSSHVVSITAATTATWQNGRASLWARVERTVLGVLEVVDLGITAITIGVNLTNAGAHDPRSINQRCLDDLRAALAGYVTGGSAHVAEYQIGDRTMKFRSLREIQDLVAYYEREIRRANWAVRPRVMVRG